MNKSMNIDAPPTQIPNIPEPPPAVDLSAGSIESSPLHAPDAAPPAIPELPSLPDFIPVPLAGADSGPGQPPSPVPARKDAAADEAHPPHGTMEEEPVPFSPELIEAMAADPVKRRELQHMHSLARNLFYTTVDKVYAMLPAAKVARPAAPAVPVPSGPTNIRMLMAAQRQGEILSRERRAVAEGIVVGSLINVDNPQWDPTVPATGKAAPPGAMATLLRMEL